MVEVLSNISTAFGLSSSAGLNAYLPLLVVALISRYTNLIILNEPWQTLTNGWVIIALVILLMIEMTVDKIPAVDTINDGLQTLGRPVAGAILFAANSGVVGELQPALALIAGLILAGSVHAAKTITRPAITTVTAGLGNWVVSVVEDIMALVVAILSILLPLLIAVLILLSGGVVGRLWYKRRARLKSV